MTTAAKIKILIAGDDRQLLREVRAHLENLVYEVATAEDGYRLALKMLVD